MAFNPEFSNWFPVGKFRFWCQKVLPLVYDDSLSYYEVLCKVVDYLNNYGEDLGVLADDYKALVEYVNHYFDEGVPDLIMQYVNEWLDEHPEATTTVQDWSLTYKKLVKGTLEFVIPEMYGAVGDGLVDDTNAIIYAVKSGKSVILSKTYLITETITDLLDDVHICGNGKIKANIQNGYVFSCSNISFNINGIEFDFLNNSYGLFSDDSAFESLTIKNCTFANAKSYVHVNGYIAQTSCIYAHAHNTEIRMCRIIDCSGHGIYLEARGAGSTAFIEDNYIDCSGAVTYDNLTSAFGIGSYQSANYNYLYSLVRISGNSIQGVLGSCIAGHSMNNQVIADNVCICTGEHAIVVQDSENCTVINNVLDSTASTSGNGASVRVQKNSITTKKVLISSNLSRGRFCVIGDLGASEITITNNFSINEDADLPFSFCKILGKTGNVAETSHDIYIYDNTIISARAEMDSIYNDKLANYNLFVGWNIINKQHIYGVGYSRPDIFVSNLLPKENGITNELQYTVSYGQVDGVTYQTNANGVALWLEVSRSVYNPKYKKVGVSFIQSEFPDTLVYGIRLYRSDGTQIKGTETQGEPGYVLGYPCNGYYNIWFDIARMVNTVGVDISEVASLRITISQLKSPNKNVAYSDVHVFAGQEYLEM